MALGTVTDLTGDAKAIELLASAIATNGAPTGTAGIDIQAVKALLGFLPKKLRVALRSTAGSGTMTATLRLWGRLGTLGWVPLVNLNAGAALAEVGADLLAFSEAVEAIEGVDRLYLEIVAIGGTSTAVTGYLVAGRQLD